MPEVELVAILDADKEGFLRSTTSLLQTAGRAARHEKGRVILYADHKTQAIKDLIAISKRHREKQIAYNKEHGITPKSVKREINESTYIYKAGASKTKLAGDHLIAKSVDALGKGSIAPIDELVAELTKDMLEAADKLEFERAAYLRDKIKELKKKGRV